LPGAVRGGIVSVVLGSEPLVAFVPTLDFERARAFYTDVLGLELLEASPFALVLRGGETVLRVTKVDAFEPHPFTVLGWTVDDIHATLAKLAAAGVQPQRYDGMSQDESGVWTTPSGGEVAWFKDPEGNVLSLTQLS
jgi:catechol 2,3-dioxygenase-like lactoylglutathione lyase family enzyme